MQWLDGRRFGFVTDIDSPYIESHFFNSISLQWESRLSSSCVRPSACPWSFIILHYLSFVSANNFASHEKMRKSLNLYVNSIKIIEHTSCMDRSYPSTASTAHWWAPPSDDVNLSCPGKGYAETPEQNMPDMLFEFAKKFWLNVVAISIGKESTPALPWKVQWLKGRKCGKQTTYHTPHTIVSLERETEKLIHHQLFCHGSVVHKEIVLRSVVCLHVCPFVYPLFCTFSGFVWFCR